MLDLLLRLLLALGIVAAAITAPRSAPEPTAVPAARAPMPSGAPELSAEPRGSRPMRSPGAPTTRPSARPTAAVTPRRSARPSTRKEAPSATPATTPGGTAHRRLAGLASWYGTGGPGMYAALHDFVDGTAVQVVVCAFPKRQATCLTVPVYTQCGACRWRKGAVLVDLSASAFLALGVPLSAGVVAVVVTVLP